MELFAKLYSSLLVFVYRCFDRIVINGYLSGLSRPEYVRDQILGPIVRVATFFPFHTTYWLNGHSFLEQELNRKRIGFRKNDNAFLAVDDVDELQAAADRLSAEIIRKQLDYWTFLLGPKFSPRERSQMNLSRFY